MDLNVKGKVYMVAAASKGLGYGIAEALAQDGAIVCIASRTPADIEQAAQVLREETGSEVHASVFDARDKASIDGWAAEIIEKYGRVDGLVVNAGGPPAGKFDNFDDEAWQAAFELTLMSSVRMIRAVLPTMRAQQSGAILTVTSSSIKEPIDVILLSNVMRSGVVSLVKSLSNDVITDGIRINNLVPGRMDTDRVRSLDTTRADSLGVTFDEARSKFEAGIPIKRYGTIQEFGKVGAFLLADAASYMTGTTVTVDGGAMKTVW